MNPFDHLNDRIISCNKCPRLRHWCQEVASVKRKSYQEEIYWGKPVPNFGDPEADLLIVGLAPAAHGANRTGRMFTGDRSGDWLYRALHKAKLANQSHSGALEDGLTLKRVLITAVCHCAPPDNKPSPEEISNCRDFLSEIIASRAWSGILCLGSLAWNETHRIINIKPVAKFGHGVCSMQGTTRLVASYHPSQQNTFTGKLTEEMLDRAVSLWATGSPSQT